MIKVGKPPNFLHSQCGVRDAASCQGAKTAPSTRLDGIWNPVSCPVPAPLKNLNPKP